MTEINIPAGPIDDEPTGAIVRTNAEDWEDATRAALYETLHGLELGAFDRETIYALTYWDPVLVATVCSWIVRARAAATAGRIVLDEPTELGMQYDTGEDMLTLEAPFIVIHTGGADEFVIPDAAQAREWAAQFAAMADALDAAGGGV